jgi:hypothetical protein
MATSVWMTLLLATRVLGAAEPSPPAPPEAAPSAEPAELSADDLLTMARDLADDGELDGARASLDRLLKRELEPTLEAEALALRATLPRRRHDVMPAMKLAAWQTALGAYLLGPHMARISYDPRRTAAPYFLGAGGGALVGAGSAIWMSAGPGLSHGQAHGVIAAQQLGGFNGAAIAWLAKGDEVNTSIGLLAGVGAGTLGGYLFTLTDPSWGESLGAHSGAVWGLAYAAAGNALIERWDEEKNLRAMLIWSDLGAVGGFALAHALDLSRSQVWAMNLGGIIGATGSLQLLGLLTMESGADDTVWALTGMVGGLVGGAVALRLATRSDREHRQGLAASAFISGTDRDVRIGLPLPTPIPSDQGLAYGLPLVAYRF